MDPITLVVTALIAGGLSGTGLSWEIIKGWLTRSSAHSPQDPDEQMRRRVDELSNALTSSGQSLADAASLLGDLQKEMTGRMKALEELRHQIAMNEELSKVSAEATKALNEIIEARMGQQERRITKIAWVQGTLFAVFGASVAILVVVFAHFLPTIK